METTSIRDFFIWESRNQGYCTICWRGFLMDDRCERIRMYIAFMKRFFLSLFQLNNLSNLIPSLIACELALDSSSNWRLHVQLLEKFSCFPKCLTSDQIYYKFVPLFFRLLSSNVSLCSVLHVLLILECGKTKTKATAVANHSQLKDAMNLWELKKNSRNPRQARENARD